MKDSEKSILIFEVAVKGMSTAEMSRVMEHFHRTFSEMFDQSIRSIVVPVQKTPPDIRIKMLNKKRISPEYLQKLLDQADKILHALPSKYKGGKTEDSPRC